MKKINVIVSALLLLASGASFANQNPHALMTDSRMRVVPYNSNNVVNVVASPFVTTSFEFGDSEVIQAIEGGDYAAWEAWSNESHPNIMFVKPAMVDSNTNLTVLTSEHVYHFRLAVATKKETMPTYNIRFTYPELEREKALNMEKMKLQEKNAVVADNETSPFDWNWDYSFSCQCSQENVPVKAFDDGKFTYFQFAPHADIPAIFLVDNDGHESLANWNMKGQYVVIQKTARQFSLRNGNTVSCVFNDHYSL